MARTGLIDRNRSLARLVFATLAVATVTTPACQKAGEGTANDTSETAAVPATSSATPGPTPTPAPSVAGADAAAPPARAADAADDRAPAAVPAADPAKPARGRPDAAPGGTKAKPAGASADAGVAPAGAAPASVADQAQTIFAAKPCLTCHKLGNQGDGVIAPNLRYVGNRRGKAWLKKWLKDPPAMKPGTMMPAGQLNDDEIEVMASFLATQRTHVAFDRMLEEANGDQAAAGNALFQKLDCITCHKVNGAGGNLANTAPDLKGVSGRHNDEWLDTWLMDPQKVKPGTFMPTFGLSKAEISALLAYLKTL